MPQREVKLSGIKHRDATTPNGRSSLDMQERNRTMQAAKVSPGRLEHCTVSDASALTNEKWTRPAITRQPVQ